VALDGRWEWLGVAAAGAAKYVTVHLDADGENIGTTAYALAAAAVLAGHVLRRSRGTGAPAARTGTPERERASGPAVAVE